MITEDSATSTPREVLGRIAGGPLHGQLVGEVARKFQHRSADEVEEAFQEAYSRGLISCRWRRDKEVYGWLRRAMVNWLIDRARRERRELAADTTSGAFLEVTDAREEPLRVLGRREERAEVRDLHRTVLKQLSDRQRRVISLHAKGAERKEIARRVAASEDAVKKDLKRVFRIARDQLVRRSGHGCPEGERLMIRYAFGLGGSAVPTEAQLHLAHCERCGQFFRELEAWREKVAVLLPLPAGQTDPAVLERGLHKAADALASLKQHASSTGAQAKQQLIDAGAQAKQHTAAGYTRAVEYTPLTGVRPGATAAAVAGCLAVGGGAAGYCIDTGVDPITGLADIVQSAPTEPAQEPTQPRLAQQPPDPPQLNPVAQPPPTPAEPAPPVPAPQPVPQPAPPPEQASPPEPPPPPPEQEQFDPAAAAAADPAPQQSSSPRQRPAPSSADAVGEFLNGP